MTGETQHLFDDLNEKLKKLEEQAKPKQKDTIIVKQSVEQEPEPADDFIAKLLRHLKDEKIVEVYQKGDGELVVVSLKNVEGWLLISLSLNVLFLLLLVTKMFKVW